MKNGFTLIELLIVVVIVALLAAIGLPQYFKSVEKNRAMEMLSVTKDIRDAYEVYYVRNGAYPDALSKLSIQIKANAAGELKSGAIVYLDGVNLYLKKAYGDGEYGFFFTTKNNDLSLKCIANTDSGKDMCKDFGGIDPVAWKVDQTFMQYALQ